MYLGSVRFFKHLIFFMVLLLIAVPSYFAFRLFTGNSQHIDEIALLNAALVDLQQDRDTLIITDTPEISTEDFEMPEDKLQNSKNSSGELSYQSLYPDMFFDETWTATEVAAKTAYLTFDDGPSERTAEVLAILKRLDVKATFFVVGQTDDRAADLMKQIVQEGHTIAAHTYSHNYGKIYESVEAYLDDFYKIFCLIQENTGISPRLFRFPGGSINVYNAGLYREIIAEMLRRGFVFYDWNVSSEDASATALAKESIIHNTLRGSEGKTRCFILLHDSVRHVNTVEALEDIIIGLRNMGFEPKNLTETVKPVAFAYFAD